MKLASLLSVGTAVLAFVGAAHAASEYYVDATHGNDNWDGSTSEIPSQVVIDAGGTIPGPKKTLEKVMTDCSPVSGDTVHAAAGVYNEGSMDKWCRVKVPSGVTLIGDDGAEKTIILGKAHEGGTQGCGENALRCVYLGSNAKVRQFTLTGGHCIKYDGSQTSGYWGGAAEGANRTTSWIYDCIITNNFSGRGAVYNLSAVDCKFKGNKGYLSTPDMILCRAYGCLFGSTDNASSSNVYQGGDIVNCTFYGTGKAVNSASGSIVQVKNCISLKDFGNYVTLSRTYYTGSVGSSVTQQDGTAKKTEAELMLDGNYQQLHGSPVINAGVNSYYGPSSTSRDLIGRNRVIEDVMDLGAYEVPMNPSDWYVDAVNGDDAEDGTTAAKAQKTLAKSLSNPFFVRGDVVHAAPGVYSDGIVTISSGARYRAIVPGYITLLADQGPEKTFILGAPDPEASANHFCGPNAVGGVVLKKNAVIRDFTLTSAYTKGLNTGSDWGAAVRCDNGLGSGETGAYVVGCVITNNVAARGAGLWGATAVRCRFNDNRASTTGADIMQGRSFSCLFGNVKNSSTHNVYQGGVHVNGTFYGTGNTTEASAGLLRNCLILKPYAGANVTYSNCVVGSTGAGYVIDASSRYVPKADMLLDDDYRPRRNSPILNLGDDALYAEFPSALGNEKDKDILGGARILNGRIDIGAHEVDSSPLSLYVNGDSGNDGNDGLTPETAFKTFAAALTNAALVTGDYVRVAPGVYSSEVMTAASVTTTGRTESYRVVVPGGIRLVSEEGPARTFIVGAPDRTNGTSANHYCGPNAVGCVRLKSGALIQGFTLTDGHAFGTDGGKDWGGAVVSATATSSGYYTDSFVVDCVITNNHAMRGGGLWGATAVRCRFNDNWASTTGVDIMQGRSYNCVFGDIQSPSGDGKYNVYQGDVHVNATFYGNGRSTHSSSGMIRNSVVLKQSTVSGVIYKNCLLGASAQSDRYNGDSDSRYATGEDLKLDANYVPTSGSPALDNAKAADYYSAFAAAHPDLAALDATGGQRVYNDVMDLGACECDYRPIFAKTLKSSRLTVTEADANVTLGEKCVNVPEGDGLTLEWNLNLDTDCTLKVATEGDGAATVTLDGMVLEPVAAGGYEFAGTAGVHTLTVTFAGTGVAVASEFRTNEGMAIIIR